MTAVPASATTIKLQWEPVTGAASYDVERSTQTVPWDTVATTRGNQNRYTDVALSSGTTYYYRVAAHVEGEDIARSDVVSVTTTVDTPAAPELVSATGAAASVDLAWDDVDGESGYRVERSSDGTSGWAAIAWTGQDVNTYTDAGLDPATTFYYRVVALTSDAGSTSAPSNVQSATTDPDASSSGPSTSEANAPTSDAPIGP